MKLEKAMEKLTDDLNKRPAFSDPVLDYAEALGIEALKRLEYLRGYSMTQVDTRLPGETEE